MQAFRSSRRAAVQREAVELPIIYSKMVDGREVEDTEVFALRGEVSILTISDAGYLSDMGLETPEAAGILRKVFEEAFGDEPECKRFREFAKRHLDNDDLAELMGLVIEETTGTPTQQSSPSSPSSPPTTTGEHSRVISLQQGPSISAIPAESLPSEAASS